jgi:hypothetical protein
MNTSQFLIPSNTAELSTYDFCSWLDHHIFKDTSLSPTGYDFLYPLTAYGGPLSANTPIVYSASAVGGPLYEICYQDFCYKQTILNAFEIYCVTTVNFILSALDESVANIMKIVYDFNDGSEVIYNDYKFTNNPPVSPKDIVVSHVYYPQNKTLTTYNPSISVVFSDCCVNTYTATICSYRCGILDIYEDTFLLDAAQSKDSFNIILTLEDQDRRQIFGNLLDLNEPLPFLSALPGEVQPVPQVEASTVVRSNTARRLRRNPIAASVSQYDYIEGAGIDLIPDAATLDTLEPLQTSNLSIQLSGTGAPYAGGTGITISA